jgi:hypothetical protein
MSRLRIFALLAAVAIVSVVAATTAPMATAAGAAEAGAPAAVAGGQVAVVAADDNGLTFKVGSDVTIAPGETIGTLVVIGGDATVAGTVRNTVVVVGGDLHVLSGASIGAGMRRGDTSVVDIGGHTTIDAGATVVGKTVTKVHVSFGPIGRALASPFKNNFGFGDFTSWLFSTGFFIILALVIAALAPGPLVRIRDRIHSRPWPSFGWGALGVFAPLPVLILLVVTVIGILVAIPLAIVLVPAIIVAWALGAMAMGAFVGQAVLRSGDRRENLMLGTVIGVGIVSLLHFVPFAGGIASFLLGLVGYGAAYMTFLAWMSGRRGAKAAAAAGGGGEVPVPVGVAVAAPYDTAVATPQPQPYDAAVAMPEQPQPANEVTTDDSVVPDSGDANDEVEPGGEPDES